MLMMLASWGHVAPAVAHDAGLMLMMLASWGRVALTRPD